LTQTVGITAAIGTNSISYQASTGRWSQVSAFRTFACLEEINSAGTRRRPLINPNFDKLQINHLVGPTATVRRRDSQPRQIGWKRRDCSSVATA
jgi:hypothetical protein